MAVKRSGNRIDANLIPANIISGATIFGVAWNGWGIWWLQEVNGFWSIDTIVNDYVSQVNHPDYSPWAPYARDMGTHFASLYIWHTGWGIPVPEGIAVLKLNKTSWVFSRWLDLIIPAWSSNQTINSVYLDWWLVYVNSMTPWDGICWGWQDRYVCSVYHPLTDTWTQSYTCAGSGAWHLTGALLSASFNAGWKTITFSSTWGIWYLLRWYMRTISIV